MIHHLSIPARDPQQVALALAEFWRAEALSFPMYPGSYIVFAGDQRGSAIEVYPAGQALIPGEADLPALVAQAAGDYSPFHAAISVPLSEAQIRRLCAGLGWGCRRVPRGPGFEVVEVWVENHTLLELLTPEMAADYCRFANPANWKTALAAAALPAAAGGQD